MFSKKEKEILRDGLVTAARRIAYNTAFRPIEEILLHSWRDTAHELMRTKGCGCTRDHDDECFLSLPYDAQVESMSDHRLLSLDAFADIVLEGLSAAIEPFFAEEPDTVN